MDAGDRTAAMFAGIVAFLPKLLAALAILVVGWIVARLLEKGVDALLAKLRFDDLLERGGVKRALDRTGTRLDPSNLVARLVYWAVELVAILMAANALGLTAVADMFAAAVTYIPNVIAALLIVTFAMVIGEFVRDLVTASAGAMAGGTALARAAKIAIVTLGIFMALNQLQVAPEIVNTAFTLLLGAVALAFGLAFGLGGREVAAEYARRWADAGRRKAEELRTMPRPVRRPGEVVAGAGTGPWGRDPEREFGPEYERDPERERMRREYGPEREDPAAARQGEEPPAHLVQPLPHPRRRRSDFGR